MIKEEELKRIEHFSKSCAPSALHAFISTLIREIRSLHATIKAKEDGVPTNEELAS